LDRRLGGPQSRSGHEPKLNLRNEFYSRPTTPNFTKILLLVLEIKHGDGRTDTKEPIINDTTEDVGKLLSHEGVNDRFGRQALLQIKGWLQIELNKHAVPCLKHQLIVLTSQSLVWIFVSFVYQISVPLDRVGHGHDVKIFLTVASGF
jgi:hypothetical protein